MGLWSKIKNAVKKIARVVKAIVRVVVRVVITIINRVTFGLPDLLLGFLTWPPKRLRLHVVILWNEQPPGGGDEMPSITQLAEAAIERTKRIYKDKFNVNVRPYSKSFIEVLTQPPAPENVLDYECGLGSEFGEVGEYFADHLAGWNAIPISVTFPITVFVVRSMKELGCSMSIAGDYIVIARDGLIDNIALAHEIGHTCGLWHSGTTTNLMFRSSPGGENVKWFQKNILRSSQHVQYW
jgi:hypothetical protein